jgi:hypothetical protein
MALPKRSTSSICPYRHPHVMLFLVTVHAAVCNCIRKSYYHSAIVALANVVIVIPRSRYPVQVATKESCGEDEQGNDN